MWNWKLQLSTNCTFLARAGSAVLETVFSRTKWPIEHSTAPLDEKNVPEERTNPLRETSEYKLPTLSELVGRAILLVDLFSPYHGTGTWILYIAVSQSVLMGAENPPVLHQWAVNNGGFSAYLEEIRSRDDYAEGFGKVCREAASAPQGPRFLTIMTSYHSNHSIKYENSKKILNNWRHIVKIRLIWTQIWAAPQGNLDHPENDHNWRRDVAHPGS